MYQVIFHLKMALQYLKYDKKVPEKHKKQLYIDIETLLKRAEALKEEWK